MEETLSKLDITRKSRLILARDFANKKAVELFGLEFSDDQEENSKILRLFYSSSDHKTKHSNILHLGLKYFSGLFLMKHITLPWYWIYFLNTYEIEVKFRIGYSSINPNSIENRINDDERFKQYMKWHDDIYNRMMNHENAINRYKLKNNGQDPLWLRAKLRTGNPITFIPPVARLQWAIDSHPEISLQDMIHKFKILRSGITPTYVDDVALYLNCKKTDRIELLDSNELFEALWQCSRSSPNHTQ